MNKQTKTFLKNITKQLRKINLINTVLIFFTYLVVISLIILSFLQSPFTDYKIGDTARRTVSSDYTFPYYDKEDIDNTLEVIQTTEPYYYNLNENQSADFSNSMKELISILQLEKEEDFIASIQKKDYEFSSDSWDYILGNRSVIAIYQNRFEYIYDIIVSSYLIINSYPEEGPASEIVLSSLNGEQTYNDDRVLLYPIEKHFIQYIIETTYPNFDTDFQDAMSEILVNTIQANAYLDVERREAIVEKELAESRLQKIVTKSDILITRGDTVTAENLSRLLAYENYRSSQSGKSILIGVIFSTLFFTLLCVLFFYFENNVFIKRRNLIIALSGFVLANLFFYLAHIGKWILPIPSFLLVLYGIIAITLPELFRNIKISVLLLLSYCMFFIFYPSFDILSFVNIVLISLLVIYSSKKLQRRQHFFSLGIMLGFLQVIFALIAYKTRLSNIDLTNLGLLIIMGMVNGIVCAMASLGIMPIVENALNVPTKFKLIELASPTTGPLLKELRKEAPGTYNHSILIGDMSEQAAEQIGYDSLLVKVGGYYHDIGKMESPNYFIENQDGKNKHDNIKPSLSVSIIKNHVKTGVEIAKKNHIPQEVIDFITGHHGTTTISYFYHQAMNLFGDENVNLEDYAYAGPRPQTKGEAIVMLGDTIEATVRAYSQNSDKFNAKIILEIIEDAIQKRMAEGQFDECDITLQELKIIQLSFFKFLTGYYHRRIEYQKK